MLTFAYPWLLLAAFLPLIVRFILPEYREPREGLRVPFMDRLEKATGLKAAEGSAVRRRSRWQRWVLHPLCWLLIVFALARPQWIGEPQTKNVPSRDMVLAVDLSGSMETQDFKNAEGKVVDRLTAVKEVVDEFIAAREGDRVGLIVFGSAAFVQTTFTEDLQAVQLLLNETRVRMAGPKTVIGDAIGLSVNMFRKSELEERVLILLTDGNDTESLIPPANAAKLAADENVVIHAIAVGDPTTVGEEAIDEKALQEVTKTTGGSFFRADDRDELVKIYERLDEMEAHENEVITHRPTTDLFWISIGAMVLVMLLYHGGCLLAVLAEDAKKRRAGANAEGVDDQSDDGKRNASKAAAILLLLLLLPPTSVEANPSVHFSDPFIPLASSTA